MTVSQMVELFDLLQDKYGSPYYTDSEKEVFLNTSQLQLILQALPPTGQGVDLDRNANTSAIFSPLTSQVTEYMNSSGVVSKATLEANLGGRFIRPLSVSWTDANGTRPVAGPVRHNNWAKYVNNSFKSPTVDDPKYYETDTNFVISPVNTSASIVFTLVKYPAEISISGDQTSELAEIYHPEIVARALDLAGIGSRDAMLAEIKTALKV